MKPEAKKVASRRLARESALKAVYAMTVGGLELDPALDPEILGHEFDEECLAYIRAVTGAVMANPTLWDERYVEHLSSQWPLERLALTDKVALRMATCEFWKMPEIPPKVTIKEYVELAERYGSKESGKFVNGVLAEVLKSSPKAEWTPPTVEDAPAEMTVPAPAAPKKRTKATWTIRSEE